MNHGIIIRLYFSPDDPRAAWRLAMFEALTLPCLQRQSCQDFSLWIRCHPAHRERLEAMDPRLRTFSQRTAREDREIGLNALAGDGEELPRFDIQTRLDSDDLVTRHFVARIHKEVERHANSQPLVVSFQPVKFELSSLLCYRMHTRYGPQRCSMFLSLYQPPNCEDYRYIYDFNHRLIWETFPRVVTVPEGYCRLVVHAQNCHTKIESNDTIIGV